MTRRIVRSGKRKVESLAVLIPTYRRSVALVRCLEALESQRVPVHEVLVVVRESDVETRDCLSMRRSTLPVRMVLVSLPGAIAARNAGLDVCRSDVVAMTDDDTVPHTDWTERILQAFRDDPSLGGLGGRDRCFTNGRFEDGEEPVVGKIRWFGNVVGNHHLGAGPIREVDVLKGANMSFRTEAIDSVRFDSRLKGSGAQPGEDLCFAIAVRNRGWKIAYDPSVVVDHYAAERDDQRFYAEVGTVKDIQAYWDYAYNQVIMVWEALTLFERFAFFWWSSLVGNRNFPGLVQALRFTPRLGLQSWQRFLIAQRAKCKAFFDLCFF